MTYMKKISLKRRTKQASNKPTRITNETVAEHREQILAGGRKFKYPVQYARHRLVVNAVIIVIAAASAFGLLTFWQLYHAHDSSTFFYRVTRILPLPVASVDGAMVHYSDYLMYYRSSEHYLLRYDQIKPKTPDGKRQLDYIRRRTLDNVVADAYAAKLASNAKLSVSDKEIDAVIEQDRNTQNGKISQETYDASALSVLNWSPEEYRLDIKKRLLMQKVAYQVDVTARNKQTKAVEILKSNPVIPLDQLAAQLSDRESKVEFGASGMVNLSASFGGLSVAAAQLEKGKLSDPIKSSTGDGYYILKLVDKNATQVNYQFIRIPLTMFKQQVEKMRADNKVKEFISIPKQQDPTKTSSEKTK